MFIALFLVIVLLLAAIHWYLWKRLVKDVATTRRGRRIGALVVVLLGVLIPVTLVGSRVLPLDQQPVLAWPGFLWLALMFYLLVTLALLELPRLALRRWTRRRAPQGDGSLGDPARGAGSQDAVPAAVHTAAQAVDNAVDSGVGPVDKGLRPVQGAVDDADRPVDNPAGPAAAATGGAGGSAGMTGQSAGGAGRPAGAVDDRAVDDGVVGGAGVDVPARSPAEPLPAPGAVDERFDPRRRLLLGRSLAATAGVLSVAAVGIGTWQAKSAPQVKRVPIRLAKLPASMAGFKIALVSDIHLGPLLGRSHTERIVRIINSVEADIVAIVGDLVDGSVAELGPAAEPLQDLRARQGSFFVTGNHEYFSGYQEWVDEVTSLGVRVLRNERVDIQGLDLAGVNDVTGEDVGDGPDFGKALDGRDASRPVVMLAHQPVQAHEAAKHGVDLQLSGHTHGGQMVPFNLLVGLEAPVVAGLGNVDGTQVYVTRGAGFWGPPVRFGAPPDISVVELHGA
ncbi:metallophosphoesterase [Dactylosporangium sp. NPDC005555]|uniref:metallophosphoesterase n=1 Tax=Dactylosporangium sp. NPDC005555 TaxID=3154889 RepID=UPI00339F6831